MTSRRITFARNQRQSMGLAESKAWDLLRGGRIDGHKFRRQHPIDRYIADFACEQLKLIIEIDGGVHDRDDIILRDHLRQEELEQLGWTVLRFTNDEALGRPELIAATVRDHASRVGI